MTDPDRLRPNDRSPEGFDRRDLRDPPASPCTRICEIGEDQICVGCFRSLREIATWGSSAPAEQWAIVDRARARARLRPERSRPEPS